MDRSFLSDAKVIEAARDFVCIRLATFEDKAEADFLKDIFRGRSGELENTVFVLLSPDGKEKLCRAGRGPNFAFRSPEDLTRAMQRIAKRYQTTQRTEPHKTTLPQMKSARLGINVGACDGLPTVIVFASAKNQLDKLKRTLAPVAIEKDLAGKFIYASTTQANDLKLIKDVDKTDSGYFVVRPDEYGLAGILEHKIPADSEANQLRTALLKIANQVNRKSKDHHRHVRKGRQFDKSWETEIPVTDPMSLRAMNRGK